MVDLVALCGIILRLFSLGLRLVADFARTLVRVEVSLGKSGLTPRTPGTWPGEIGNCSWAILLGILLDTRRTSLFKYDWFTCNFFCQFDKEGCAISEECFAVTADASDSLAVLQFGVNWLVFTSQE